jgi:2-polyprenyl-3-methyl-5-hydroxy-6-metoxy-1,4-benzoquinol methylase
LHHYREKIYRHYSSNRIGKLAPDTVEGFRPRAPYFLKLMRDHFPVARTAAILEIGCGHGAFLYFMHQAGYRNASGIDGSPEQVREAHRLGISDVRHANLTEHLKTLADDTLDVLVAIDVIEHFTKEELSRLVDEFYRVLKPGGRLISHQPNGEGPFGSFMRHWDFTHENGFTRQSIAQLLLSSNFRKVASYEDKPVIHGIKSLGRYVIWEFFLRQIYRFVRIVETGSCDADAIFTLNFTTVAEK